MNIMGGSDFFSEDKSISKFNEASLKLLRINVEQQKINICNSNLLAWNEEVLRYNFQIKFSSLNSLFVEVSSELTYKGRGGDGGELKQGMDKRKEIREFMKKNPIFEQTEDQVTHANVTRFSEENWDELEEMLFEYELMVKKFFKSHGIGLPESEDPARAAYN